MQGTIKKIMDRGFGFIARDGEKDLFFHSNDLKGITFDELTEGTEVTFEIEEGQKGPAAKNVQVVGSSTSSDDMGDDDMDADEDSSEDSEEAEM